MTSSARRSGSVAIAASSFIEAGSAHCKFSRSSTSGVPSARRAPSRARRTRCWNRCSASTGPTSATGGASPMSCCSSGTLSVRTRPFGATADRMRSRSAATRSAGWCNVSRTKPRSASRKGRTERCPGVRSALPSSHRHARAGEVPDLVDEGRLADARGPGDEHDLRATGRDALDGSLELLFAPARVRTGGQRSGDRTARRGGRARRRRSCPSSASGRAPRPGRPRARRRSGSATRASSRGA